LSKLSASEARSRTILIIDDTPANLGVVARNLEANNCDILVAQDGEEGLRRAALAQPDLILLDVMMPGIDGIETCRRLKAAEATRAIPVIFMTALADVTDKVAGFAAGGVDYVTKPFQVEELLARVNTHLALRAIQQEVAGQNRQLEDEIAVRRETEGALRQVHAELSVRLNELKQENADRQRAEAALRMSEIRYRRLFETAMDGIVLLDFATARIIEANPAFGRMFGYVADQLAGQVFTALEPFRSIPDLHAVVADLRARGTAFAEHWALTKSENAGIDVEFVGGIYHMGDAKVIQCNFRDITDRKKAEARIQYMALHDALTGLPNRTLLEDRLNQIITRALRNQKRAAVLLLDLDHFKVINDSLGHHVGDQLLEIVATRLREALRASDTAARLGGDEFVIVLPEIGETKEAAIVARKLLKILVEPFFIDGNQLHVGGSIGISTYPTDGVDPGTLVRAADTAMYDAKRKGRGTFQFFTPELNEAAQRRLRLANDLRHACARDELSLHYQPQIDAQSGAITGVEALLRWHHPEQGLIGPAQFVPLLEEIGLIVDVGRWVLWTACLQNAKWVEAGLPPVRMGVNVSATQFYRGDIVRTVEAILNETGLNPELLELELTESLTLDDTETTIKIMHDLKRLGVRLSLDDFGTGWSSLAYLRRFPLDRIKIDRSFIREVDSDATAAAVAQSVMSLAENLGLGCIAEGVETVEQRNYLQGQRCAELQGYLFSPALPKEEFEAFLRASSREAIAP
jgi:diguanylate cyclase (GGDEF)-like protein/PAS domain S-box-containing protein